MITVTQQFKDELKANVSGGIRYSVMLSDGTTDRDVTSLLSRKSLRRITWKLEDKITDFQAGDLSITIWDDGTIWDWIHDSEDIKISLSCGFVFEKVNNFNGYLDKPNCERRTEGLIDLRGIPNDKYLERYKMSEITNTTNLNPTLVKNVVSAIFDHIGVPNQTIEPVAMSTYGNKHIDNYIEMLDRVDIHGIQYCPVSDSKFFIWSSFDGIQLIEFNDDWTDYTVTDILATGNYLGAVIRFEKWRDDLFVAVMGKRRWFYFNNNPYDVEHEDYEATRIIMLDADGNVDYNFEPSEFDDTVGALTYTFYPLARGIQPIFDERVGIDKFIIAYNGVGGLGSPKVVNVCWYRLFALDNPTVATDTKTISNNYYFHPEGWQVMTSEGAWFAGGIVVNTAFSGDLFLMIIDLATTAPIHISLASDAPGWLNGNGAWSCGRYVILSDNGYAYDASNFQLHDDFLPSGYNSTIACVQTNAQNPRSVLTGYNSSTGKMIHKILSNNTYSENEPDEALRGIYYKNDEDNEVPWNLSLRTGFKYWHTNTGKYVSIYEPNLDQIYDSSGIIGIWANKMMPFMDWPGGTDEEADVNVMDVLRDIAIAFNCIFWFPSFTEGHFLNRNSIDSEYSLSKNLIIKHYTYYIDHTYRVVVQYHGNEFRYGTNDHELTFYSPYIPNHEVAAQTIAKNYYDFFNTYRYVIDLNADFPIFLQLYDYTYIHRDFEGFIMKTTQENDKMKIEIRGKEFVATGTQPEEP